MKTIQELLSDVTFMTWVILTIILLLTWIARDISPAPKYKAGDCVAPILEEATEFRPVVLDYKFAYRILQVRKRQYQIMFLLLAEPQPLSMSILYVDSYTVKINCEDAK